MFFIHSTNTEEAEELNEKFQGILGSNVWEQDS